MKRVLSGPVGDKKRITKPDPKKKNETFKAVSNKTDDVALVQIMLCENGHKTPVDGKCTSGLIKTIQAFQKAKLKFDKPDGIVDPGGKTWNAGKDKLNAKLDQIEKTEMVTVEVNGKPVYMTGPQFQKHQEEIRKAFKTRIDNMFSDVEMWIDFTNDVNDTLSAADGYMNAFAEWTMRSVNASTKPPTDTYYAARSALSSVKALLTYTKPDWAKIVAKNKIAVKLYNKAVIAQKKYIASRIETGSSLAGGLQVYSDISETVLQCVLTVKLVAWGKMPPAVAYATAGATTKGVTASINEMGHHLAGNNVTFTSSAKRVAFDATLNGITSGIGGAIGAKFANGAAMRIGQKLTTQFPTIPQKMLSEFFTKFLQTGVGQGFVEESVKSTVDVFAKSLKSGKPPTEKQVQEEIIKIMLGSIFKTPAVKNLKAFDVAVGKDVAKTLEEKLVPAQFEFVKKQVMKKYNADILGQIPQSAQKELQSEAVGSFVGKAREIGSLYAVDKASGLQSESQMLKLANDGIKRDAAFRKQLNDKMLKDLEALAKAQANMAKAK